MTDNTQSNFLSRAFALSSPFEAVKLYDEWASTYDKYLEGVKYQYPRKASEALRKAVGGDLSSLRILDAGCGTGLAGRCLKSDGARHIDGLDISPGMLELARKTEAYQDLGEADLNKPIDSADEAYDAVTCVGTFTSGHLGPDPMDELLRVTKKGGFVVATIGANLWEKGGFKAKADELMEVGKAKVISSNSIGITEGGEEEGWLVVFKRL